jgi:aminomethyltransferase
VGDHLTRELAEVRDAEIVWSDVTRLWAMFAVQGPRSVELLQPLVDVDLQWMRYYRGTPVRILHPAAKRQGAIISRTGYTGEDGFELSLGASIARDVWEVLLELGKPLGVVPTGLGARDTLRMEAGMPLYGHELSEDVNPFEAGLGFACHLVGYDFPGRDALKRLAGQPLRRTRVGLELPGRRIARQGAVILSGGAPIGQVTSGTFSPTLQKSIAMGYVHPEHSKPGTELTVDLRGRIEPARVVELPFYRRETKGAEE